MERSANLDGSSRLFLGIEIGGTKLQLGLGRGDGHLRALLRKTVVPEHGALGIIGQILAAFGPLLDAGKVNVSDLEALGIGFGGPVDAARGIALKSHQVQGWESFPLADVLRRELGVARVAVENDADAAALAEARLGAGVGCDPLLYITIGSGIGGGLIVGNEIYRGSGRGAVEIGHLWSAVRPALGGDEVLYRTADPCRLEDIASGWAIDQAGRAVLRSRIESRVTTGILGNLCGDDPALVNARLLGAAAGEGDVESGRILRDAAVSFAVVLANAITLLAPRRVVLGGGVSLLGEEHWLDPIRETVKSWVFPPYVGTFDIVPARLGEEVVVHGAIEAARSASLQIS